MNEDAATNGCLYGYDALLHCRCYHICEQIANMFFLTGRKSNSIFQRLVQATEYQYSRVTVDRYGLYFLLAKYSCFP